MSSTKQLVWLITGASSGFGKRLVSIGLKRGDRIIATARSLDKLHQTFPSTHDNLRLLQLDVTAGFEAIKQIMDDAIAIWGVLDVLVNNAGIGVLGLLEESGTAMLRRLFDTNVFGVLDVSNAVLPHMRARKEGTIVVVGSRSAWRSETPALGSYAASKAAVHAVAMSLRTEVAPFNIRVLILAPGSNRTEGMALSPFNDNNKIPDYDTMRTMLVEAFGGLHGNQPGDPEKAMQVTVDAVRGEGVAEGKSWPWMLLLGNDAEEDIKARWKRYERDLEEWGDITRSVSFDG
ncbi:hypothetical protein C8J56DRAFT_922318 [Mycena floridula]|nr:hypothetical protein C8J56DRAFT_922318 [Mycena floridula]